MSRESVEICRRVAELLGGDKPTASVHAALEYADPEIVFESAIVSGAKGGIYRAPNPEKPDTRFERLLTGLRPALI